MANKVRKTEHSGAKHGRGAHWGTKLEAKAGSKKLRRRNWKQELKWQLKEGTIARSQRDTTIVSD